VSQRLVNLAILFDPFIKLSILLWAVPELSEGFQGALGFWGQKLGSTKPLLRSAFSRPHKVTKGSRILWDPHNLSTDFRLKIRRVVTE
jgi:hypothetical protein